jgi:hypothetical protein
MKTIKTIADLAAVLAVYPQTLPLSFTVNRAPVELATDMQIHQLHHPDTPELPDVLHIALMDPAAQAEAMNANKDQWVVCVQDGDDKAYTIFSKDQLENGLIDAGQWENYIAVAGLNHPNYEAIAELIAAAPRVLAERNALKTAKAELYHALGLSAAALRRALAVTPHDDEFYGLTDKTEQNCRAVMAKHKGAPHG